MRAGMIQWGRYDPAGSVCAKGNPCWARAKAILAGDKDGGSEDSGPGDRQSKFDGESLSSFSGLVAF